MADNYGYLFGVPGSTKPEDNEQNQSELFKTLLKQTMAQGGSGNPMSSFINSALGTGMAMYGQPGMLGAPGLTANTGMAGDSLGQVSLPASAWGA